MKKTSAIILVILAIAAAVMAYVYFTKTAGNLPHFFPGYSQSSSHKHTKHGVAFASLAVVLLIGAWMVSGKSSDKDQSTPTEPTAE